MAGGEEGHNFLFTPKSSVMLTAMLKKLAISFSVLTLILASGFAASAAPKKKILFFTKSSGFEHSVISWKNGQPGYAEKVQPLLVPSMKVATLGGVSARVAFIPRVEKRIESHVLHLSLEFGGASAATR